MLHENVLKFSRFRYLKGTSLLVLGSGVAYLWDQPETVPNGGTWLGYTLGTIGALMILWLMLFGVRKRAEYEKDAVALTLQQVVTAGIIGGVIFVLSLVMLVRFITR